MADFVTVMGFEDSAVDRGLQNVDRKFSVLGTKIEQRTEGVRRFTGALSGTIGVVTGILGVVTLVGGAIGGIIALTQSWKREQEEVAKKAQETFDRIEAIRKQAADFGRGGFQLGGAEELKALERLQELRTTGALRVNSTAFSADEIAAAREEEAALLELIERIRDARASAAAQDRIARAFAREEEFARQQEQLRLLEEREAAERRAAEAAAERERERQRAIELEAEGLKRQIEIDEARARGLDEQAEALERQRDLQRTIRSIEESEGLSPAERRDLIERAKETARLEAEAAKAKRAAAQATGEATPAGRAGAVSLAAGTGGGAVLARQALGAGGSPAEQQQLATQRSIAKMVERIHQTIDDLRRTSNQRMAF